jgi:hypothetical protein
LYQGQEHEEGERNWPRVPCWIQEEVMTDGQSVVSLERKYWELKWELTEQYLIE